MKQETLQEAAERIANEALEFGWDQVNEALNEDKISLTNGEQAAYAAACAMVYMKARLQ